MVRSMRPPKASRARRRMARHRIPHKPASRARALVEHRPPARLRATGTEAAERIGPTAIRTAHPAEPAAGVEAMDRPETLAARGPSTTPGRRALVARVQAAPI